MAINPLQLFQLKDRLRIFREQHPKVLEFLQAVAENNIQPGVVMELRVTDTDNKTMVTNIRLTPEDIETFKMLKELKGEE